MDEYEPQWFVHGHVHLNYDANLPRVCPPGNHPAPTPLPSAMCSRSRTRTP